MGATAIPAQQPGKGGAETWVIAGKTLSKLMAPDLDAPPHHVTPSLTISN
jgi:hypothetical protein